MNDRDDVPVIYQLLFVVWLVLLILGVMSIHEALQHGAELWEVFP